MKLLAPHILSIFELTPSACSSGMSTATVKAKDAIRNTELTLTKAETAKNKYILTTNTNGKEISQEKYNGKETLRNGKNHKSLTYSITQVSHNNLEHYNIEHELIFDKSCEYTSTNSMRLEILLDLGMSLINRSNTMLIGSEKIRSNRNANNKTNITSKKAI